MTLWAFYVRNSQEVLGLVGQHLYLVAISTGAAIVIGVPLGILLTRRPAWRGPVLGVANVFQTVPSLALFGFLTGVRVATVVSVGTATIAAAIGAGGLGVYIFRGVAVVDDTLILAGALPAALMALTADGLLGVAARRFAWRAK